MGLKSFLVGTGFLFFFCFAQAEDDAFGDDIDAGPSDAVTGTFGEIDTGPCFKGYADSKELKSSPQLFRECLCAMLGKLGQIHCRTVGDLLPEVTPDISAKAAEVYYDDCYCRKKGQKGKLSPIQCSHLRKTANVNNHNPYEYDCYKRSPSHGRCSEFSPEILDIIFNNINCNESPKTKDDCNNLITGFLASPQCSPKQTWAICSRHIESRLLDPSCQPASINVVLCTGTKSGEPQSACGVSTTTATPTSPYERNNPTETTDNDKIEDKFDTNVKVEAGEKNDEIVVDDSTPSPSEDEDKEAVSPFPEDTGSPVNPISLNPGNIFGDSTKRRGGTGVSPVNGGGISSSRARVPGAGVSQPGPINTGGGANGLLPPRVLMDMTFSNRGRPGPGGTLKNDSGSGSRTSGPRGGMGGMPGSMGGGAQGGGRSAGRKPRHRRRGNSSSSGRYMSAPGRSQGGSYRSEPSFMNRQVKQQMEKNKKKGLNTQNINALLQKRLRESGSAHGASPQSFTPVFYFPNIEKVYEDLNNQSQFLNGKGTDR